MTENDQAPNVPVKLPPPHPDYHPAKTDTLVIVKFIGNTPQVQELRFIGACAEHAMAASERLKIYYHRAQAIADEKARARGILTADTMPESGLAKG